MKIGVSEVQFMAPRKRNRIPSAPAAHRSECLGSLTNGCPPVKRCRIVKSPADRVKHRSSRRSERVPGTTSDVKRDLENMVSQDPKLNGELIPTVPLESSSRSPMFSRKNKSPVKNSSHPLMSNKSTPGRILRTGNSAPQTLFALSRRETPKICEAAGMKEPRMRREKSLSFMNMLAPVFSDCKLNGATAPRVVLRRLNIKQLLQNGVTPVRLPEEINYQNFHPARDLNSRKRRKGIRPSRNLNVPTRNNRNVQRTKESRQKFESVPCQDKKWWTSYPLKQVAVRLTKLPL